MLSQFPEVAKGSTRHILNMAALGLRITFIFALSASVAVSLPVESSEIKKLTAYAGENLTLSTGSDELQDDDSVLWSCDNGKKTLVTCDAKKSPTYHQENIKLDPTTGALTLGPLSVDDSNVYEGEIYINNIKHTFKYEVTVSEAGSSTGTSPNTAHTLTSNLGCVFAAALVGRLSV
ncbi:uncharacterized protein LOC117816112 [Notolabrus celidotus]|uniref:uncharacterized protein LOC117816112 n=1 Tax=Notolabrus celidotus TaxID=1203425 RepID=UPI00148FC5BD|nr:uncharacterized protein LOC117816112 [Notolabrus celidotus]